MYVTTGRKKLRIERVLFSFGATIAAWFNEDDNSSNMLRHLYRLHAQVNTDTTRSVMIYTTRIQTFYLL